MNNHNFLATTFMWIVMAILAACGGSGSSGGGGAGGGGGAPAIAAPGAPGIGVATAGDAQATVSFTPPAFNGGAAITNYTVTSSPGGLTASGTASPLTVTGLTNGQTYSFTVTATNSAGTGPASPPSNSITLFGVTSVNVSVTTLKELTFTWSEVAGATHYKLLKNPTGASGYTQLGADLPSSVTTVTDTIGVHLHDWVNASYIVQACNTAGCFSSSAIFTTTVMLDAIGYFKASNTGSGDQFGYSVALSADGATLAVGAPEEDSSTTGINSTPNEDATDAGAVYVFSRSGSTWSQQAYIKAFNTRAGDNFGTSVALSADGMTLAVSAERESSNTTGINSTPSYGGGGTSGAAYVFIRSGSTWSQEAYIKASNAGVADLFGRSVSLSADGSTLAVGAHQEASSTTGINSTPDEAANSAGAVYVFIRSGSTWSQEAYIKASNTGAGDNFGSSVALSADGNTLAVGAHNEDSSTTGINSTPNEDASASGAAYVFTRSGSTWSQQVYIKASNTRYLHQFGFALSLSGDGNTLAVGAYQENGGTTGVNSPPNNNSNVGRSGAAYVFNRSGSTWSQEAYIKASNTGDSDIFGISVALSADGKTLAVGATGEDSSTTGINSTPNNSADNAGAVYVFIKSDSSWSQRAFVKASNTEPGDRFGRSVALSLDGTTLAVGAPNEDSSTTGINSTPYEDAIDAGAVYLY